jgi:two-component system, chemotaxis family, chemotaxis protein CheY
VKILIVDDDEVARLALSANLGAAPVEIIEASDGQEAWEMLTGGLRPAICCSDVAMPRMNGIELVQRARAHPVLRNIPFVLISSAAGRETVEAAVAGGVAGYILKPFMTVQTRATVERVLHERRTAQAEHFLVTRRRLDVELEQLEKLLRVLSADAGSLFERLGSEGGEAILRGLQRLQSASVVLGLWQCASMLQQALDSGSAGDRGQIVQEVIRLVDEQLMEVRQLSPSAR